MKNVLVRLSMNGNQCKVLMRVPAFPNRSRFDFRIRIRFGQISRVRFSCHGNSKVNGGELKLEVWHDLVTVKVRDKFLVWLCTMNGSQCNVLTRIAAQTSVGVCVCVSPDWTLKFSSSGADGRFGSHSLKANITECSALKLTYTREAVQIWKCVA